MLDPLFCRLALPDDDDLDDFDSGVEEVNAFFRTRAWFKNGKMSPATYQFRTRDNSAVVGYAAAAFGNRQHPNDAVKAKYLIIYAFGVHRHFQGKRNEDASHETYAASMMRMLEKQVVDNAAAKGLTLQVRCGNARAIAYYARCGFKEGQVGVVRRDEADAFMTLWKLVR